MTSDLPPTIVASPAFLLSKIGQAIARRFHATMAQLDLHPRDYAVLSAIASESSAQGTVGERLRIDPSTMVAVIDGLSARGLLTRDRDTEDRRRYSLTLTATGRGLLKRADAAALRHTDAVLAPLSPAQREQLRMLLQALLDGGDLPPGLPSA
jgi:MarR family transcriptional regulator, lower aerobic nicotinate degradation pathway regulator